VSAAQRDKLWARGLLATGVVGCVVLAVILGIVSQSPLYALGVAALAATALLRPQLGVLALLALSSVDLIGTAEWGRFTVRASQVVALALTGGVAVQLVRDGELLKRVRQLPRSLWIFVAFCLWAAARLALFDAPNPVRGYAYATWALFDVGVVAAGLALTLSRVADLERALRVWIAALTAIALFGILQWAIGVAGGTPPFVTQWMDAIPRINGLSYEPSYFAFSITAGLAMAMVGIVAERSFIRPRQAAACGGVIVVALLLASSRSGWIGLAVLSLGLLAASALRWSRLRRPQRQGLAILGAGYLLGGALLALGPSGLYADMARKGLDTREQSSSAPRLEGVQQALEMARRNPLVGVGLAQFGGTLAAADGQERSEREVDAMVTFNLYAELLAENGLVGLLLVLWGLLLCAVAAWRAWRARLGSLSTVAGALLAVGCLQFGIMYQFNQTLFRTDVWCLLGLTAAVAMARSKGQTVKAQEGDA